VNKKKVIHKMCNGGVYNMLIIKVIHKKGGGMWIKKSE
jgi:hypothetical protein